MTKILIDEAVVRQALEALESGDWYINQLEMIVYSPDDDGTHEERERVQKATTALRQALEQPAPAQEPVAWMQDSIELYVQDRPSATYTIPLYTTPPAPAQPLTDEQQDAARYRWLKPRMMGADFDWNESGACALVFEWPRDVQIGADCDRNIDSAIEAAHGITKGGAA